MPPVQLVKEDTDRKRHVSLYVPSDLWARLKSAADAQYDGNVSMLVRRLLDREFPEVDEAAAS